MKKVLKPYEKEESVFYSDFTGKCFGEFEPEVTLTMHFNYGSKYDGATLKLHLTDEEAEKITAVIKQNLSVDTKNDMKKRLQDYHDNLNNSVDARDWSQSEYYGNSIIFVNHLLNNEQ